MVICSYFRKQHVSSSGKCKAQALQMIQPFHFQIYTHDKLTHFYRETGQKCYIIVYNSTNQAITLGVDERERNVVIQRIFARKCHEIPIYSTT